ncbi:MAG: thiol-disulfide oxidoreductase DCC family protein [bacterium]
MITPSTDYPIIFFDGVCNFCNSSVNFIIKRDKNRIFRYAALQSNAGQKLLERLSISNSDLDTVILFDGNQIYEKSGAALEIVYLLPGAWKFLYIFRFIPRFVRDFLYDLFARNRYKIFGKREMCMMPSPQIKELFMD